MTKVLPGGGSPAVRAPEFAAMHQYAGQMMTTGAQAEVLPGLTAADPVTTT